MFPVPVEHYYHKPDIYLPCPLRDIFANIKVEKYNFSLIIKNKKQLIV